MNQSRLKPKLNRYHLTVRKAVSVLPFLCLFALSSANAQYEYVSQFGQNGLAAGEFRTVTGVAVDSQGMLLIADRENDRVQICSFSGECTILGEFTPPLLRDAYGIAEDHQGRVVVTESFAAASQVQVCEREVVSFCDIKFGGVGSDSGQFTSPRGVVVDS